MEAAQLDQVGAASVPPEGAQWHDPSVDLVREARKRSERLILLPSQQTGTCEGLVRIIEDPDRSAEGAVQNVPKQRQTDSRSSLSETLAAYPDVIALVPVPESIDIEFSEAVRRHPTYALDVRAGGLVRIPGGNDALVTDLLQSGWLDRGHVAMVTSALQHQERS